MLSRGVGGFGHAGLASFAGVFRFVWVYASTADELYEVFVATVDCWSSSLYIAQPSSCAICVSEVLEWLFM